MLIEVLPLDNNRAVPIFRKRDIVQSYQDIVQSARLRVVDFLIILRQVRTILDRAVEHHGNGNHYRHHVRAF